MQVQPSAFSFYHTSSGAELRLSDLAAATLTHSAILLASTFFFIVIVVSNLSVGVHVSKIHKLYPYLKVLSFPAKFSLQIGPESEMHEEKTFQD